ncbi:hypothetical protein F1880_000340 [Penicillium rolfsii]|nr:hypothetical protein F1880_000340 [Penicillium rolfsii]
MTNKIKTLAPTSSARFSNPGLASWDALVQDLNTPSCAPPMHTTLELSDQAKLKMVHAPFAVHARSTPVGLIGSSSVDMSTSILIAARRRP